MANDSLPRVTEILRDAGLVDATWFTEHVRERGTAVHLACQYEDEGDLDEASVAEELRPYLAQYRRWKAEMRPEILKVERRVERSDYRYRGTLDRIVTIEGRRWLVDIKTGGTCAPWHALQTMAYAIGCGERTIGRACLHLTPEGYSWHPHTNSQDERAFLAALTLANWKRMHNLI